MFIVCAKFGIWVTTMWCTAVILARPDVSVLTFSADMGSWCIVRILARPDLPGLSAGAQNTILVQWSDFGEA